MSREQEQMFAMDTKELDALSRIEGAVRDLEVERASIVIEVALARQQRFLSTNENQ